MAKRHDNRSVDGGIAIDAKTEARLQDVLRKTIRGASVETIRVECGYSDERAVRLAQARALAMAREMTKELALEDLTRRLIECDEMQSSLMPQALLGDGSAIDRVLRIMDRRAKYLGQDAPVRADVTAPATTPTINIVVTPEPGPTKPGPTKPGPTKPGPTK